MKQTAFSLALLHCIIVYIIELRFFSHIKSSKIEIWSCAAKVKLPDHEYELILLQSVSVTLCVSVSFRGSRGSRGSYRNDSWSDHSPSSHLDCDNCYHNAESQVRISISALQDLIQ